MNRFQLWLATREFHKWPDLLWFLVASPLLRYAFGPCLDESKLSNSWFAWPKRGPFLGEDDA